MSKRVIPLIAAFLTLTSVYFVGVVFFYKPIAEADSPDGALVPPAIALLISTMLYVLLFAWVAEQMNHSIKAAFTIAIAQLLLVDIDYTLSGDRGLATAGASSVLLLVGWGATGFVHHKLARRAER